MVILMAVKFRRNLVAIEDSDGVITYSVIGGSPEISKVTNSEWYKVKASNIDNLPGHLNDKVSGSLIVNDDNEMQLKGDMTNLQNLDVYYGVNESGDYGFWTMEQIFEQVALKPKGNYDNEIQYNPLDFVYYRNRVWVCKKTPPIGTEPSVINEEFWMLILSTQNDIEIGTDDLPSDNFMGSVYIQII